MPPWKPVGAMGGRGGRTEATHHARLCGGFDRHDEASQGVDRVVPQRQYYLRHSEQGAGRPTVKTSGTKDKGPTSRHCAAPTCATASSTPIKLGAHTMGSGLPTRPYTTHIIAVTRFMKIIGKYNDSLRARSKHIQTHTDTRRGGEQHT